MSGLLSSSQLNTFLDKNHVSSLIIIIIFLGGKNDNNIDTFYGYENSFYLSKQQVVTGSRIQEGKIAP